MIGRSKIECMLAEAGVVKEGHFLLASGLHSQYYFEKFRLLEQPGLLNPFCEELAGTCRQIDFHTVCGPTTGGVIIAYEVARLLQKRCLFAEKTPQGRGFLRKQEILKGESFIVVDDVLTTGGSVRATMEAIGQHGGNVVAVGVLIDRSETPPDFGIPLHSVYKNPVKNHTPHECPLCKSDVPLVKPGGKG